jgi:hypothetical protein
MFRFIVERKAGEQQFTLWLENVSNGRKLEIATANTKRYLQDKPFCKGVQWCDGDDPNYDSCEPFDV